MANDLLLRHTGESDAEFNARFLERERTKVHTQIVDHGGERVRTGNGAEREVAAGKGRFDLIPAYPMERLAKHYEAGAQKYAERNWEKGIPLKRFLNSLERHLNKFKDGDRSEDHLAAVLWNAAGYIWTERALARHDLPPELKDVPWPDSVQHEGVKK